MNTFFCAGAIVRLLLVINCGGVDRDELDVDGLADDKN